MIEAIHFNKTHKEESKAIWGKYLKVSDKEGLERAWQAHTAAYPDNLLPTPEGTKTALDDLAPRDARAGPRIRARSSTRAWCAKSKRRDSSNSSTKDRRRLYKAEGRPSVAPTIPAVLCGNLFSKLRVTRHRLRLVIVRCLGNGQVQIDAVQTPGVAAEHLFLHVLRHFPFVHVIDSLPDIRCI